MMKRFAVVLVAVFLVSCGSSLNPKWQKVHEFTFKYDNKNIVKDEKKVQNMVEDIEKQFDPYVKGDIWKHFHARRFTQVEIFVQKNKPVSPIREIKSCEYSYPQDSSSVYHKSLFEKECGQYTIGKHFVDVVFDVREGNKYEDAHYDKETGKWSLDIEKVED